jgi:hypothetical protein
MTVTIAAAAAAIAITVAGNATATRATAAIAIAVAGRATCGRAEKALAAMVRIGKWVPVHALDRCTKTRFDRPGYRDLTVDALCLSARKAASTKKKCHSDRNSK